MALDLILLGMVGLGALSGWRQGFIVPLLTIAATFFVLADLYTGAGVGVMPSGSLGLGLGLGVAGLATGIVARISSPVMAVVHRVPLVRAGDHTLGLPLGTLTAFVGAYLGLTTLLAVDGFLAPLHGKLAIDAAAVTSLQTALAADPQYRVIADPAVLDQIAAQASQVAIPREELSRYDRMLSFYEDRVRPEILSSRVGPIVVRVGELIPVLGHPVAYPTK